MWSFCGIDQIGVISGEVENPSKTIPKAMTIAIIVIALAYMLPLIGAMAVPGWESWYAGSYVEIGTTLGGQWLGIAVAIGGSISALGTYASLLLSNSRIPFVLARDSWLTPRLARESKRYGSPITAIIVSSVIYALFTMGSFADLVLLDVFTINLLLLFNLVALIVLRVREPNLHRPMKIPFGWFGIAGVGIPLVAGIVFLMYLQFTESDLASILVLLGSLVLSVLAYFPARASQRRRHAAQHHDFARQK
jgi:amino acid transporter